MATNYFILAGEASGDLHGGKLLTAIKGLDPSARFVGMGGPRMAAAGLEVAKDLEGMQVMGFWEVAKHYGFFRRVFHQLLDRVKQERPVALICIDYPGFNLRFAKRVRAYGIPTFHYIVPQVWAWKPKRAAAMARFIDRAFCVFDFEPPFFEKFRNAQRPMRTIFVGHPLLDQEVSRPDLKALPDRRNVSLLTGSRPIEFAAHGYPLAMGFRLAAQRLGNLRGFMSVPKGLGEETLRACASWLNGGSGEQGKGPGVRFSSRSSKCLAVAPLEEGPEACKAIEALEASEVSHGSLLPGLSEFSVVKSGTSTLEAGLQQNPFCVVYKPGRISYAIANLLVDIPVFSLINVVLGRHVVPEFVLDDVHPERIAFEIERGLTDMAFRERQMAGLAKLPAKLGGPGASTRAAKGILDYLSGKE